jgi:uncharacterized protein (DUF2132 family)
MQQEIGNKQDSSKDPLHGKTLEAILTALVELYGWEELGARIKINCFRKDPSIKSSLVFLRKTPWARTKTENLYLKSRKKIEQLKMNGGSQDH